MTFIAVVLISLPLIFAQQTYMTIYYTGQNPFDGKFCEETVDCTTLGSGYSAWDPSTENMDICCVEKPCEFEKTYYYSFFGWDGAKKALGQCETNPYDCWDYATAAAYTVDYDTQEWACTACAGIWEPTADNGNGQCCGDDSIGDNPSGIDTTTNGDDPDMGPEACQYCALGQYYTDPGLRHWGTLVPSDNNRCCGDDVEDCGALVNSYLCTDIPGTTSTSTSISNTCTDPNDPACSSSTSTTTTTEQGPWYWRNAADGEHTGVIISSACAEPDAAYVSDGQKWLGCTALAFPDRMNIADFDILSLSNLEVENPYEINNHDYLCYYEEEPDLKLQIGECCGGTSSQSAACNNDYRDAQDLGGQDFFSGNSAKISTYWFFCNENFTFSKDLDQYPFACDHAKYPNGTSRGYLWTGTKCCSDPEDGQENYNDEDRTGACFKGKPIRNGHFPEDLNELSAINGVLMGCNISSNSTRYKPDNQWLLEMIDSHTGEPLIEEVGFCTVEPTGNSYCDFSEEWKPTWDSNLGRQTNRSNLAYVPSHWTDVEIEAGCCEATECWNGSLCYPNQAGIQPPNVLSHAPRNDGFRCSEGQWEYSELKTGLDGYQGYCPRNDQCLVSYAGNYEDNNNPDANPQCISDGQFIYGNYCEEGKWSSRAKLLALTLLDSMQAESDYTLYCGPYYNTLNYYDYTADFTFVKNLFEQGDINNICLLDYGNQLILATSINAPLNESAEEIEDIFKEFKDCNFNQIGYVSCDNDNKAWYNTEINAVFFSKKSFQLINQPDYTSIYNAFLEPKLTTLISSLENTPPTSSFSFAFLDDGLKLDRIYLIKKADKQIFATLDDSTLIVSFDNIALSEIPVRINAYNESHKPANDYTNAEMAASQSGNTINIISTGGQWSNINPYAIWSDLTGKLRLE
jgi:hypothetical protein